MANTENNVIDILRTNRGYWEGAINLIFTECIDPCVVYNIVTRLGPGPNRGGDRALELRQV